MLPLEDSLGRNYSHVKVPAETGYLQNLVLFQAFRYDHRVDSYRLIRICFPVFPGQTPTKTGINRVHSPGLCYLLL